MAEAQVEEVTELLEVSTLGQQIKNAEANQVATDSWAMVREFWLTEIEINFKWKKLSNREGCMIYAFGLGGKSKKHSFGHFPQLIIFNNRFTVLVSGSKRSINDGWDGRILKIFLVLMSV